MPALFFICSIKCVGFCVRARARKRAFVSHFDSLKCVECIIIIISFSPFHFHLNLEQRRRATKEMNSSTRITPHIQTQQIGSHFTQRFLKFDLLCITAFIISCVTIHLNLNLLTTNSAYARVHHHLCVCAHPLHRYLMQRLYVTVTVR